MEQTEQEKPAVEVKESKKETIATYSALIICLLPSFYIILFWYNLYQAFTKDYNGIIVGVVVFIIAYLIFIIVQAILKQIILFIIK